MQANTQSGTALATVVSETEEPQSDGQHGRSSFLADLTFAAVINSSVVMFMWVLLEFGGKR